MTDPTLLTNAAIWLGGYDLSGYLNSINIAAAKAELDNRRFADTGEVFYPGLEQITAELSGFFSAASTSDPDPVAWPRIDATVTPSVWPLLSVPPYSPSATPNTVGNRGYLVVGNQFNYNPISGAHGEALGFSLASRLGTSYKLYRQTIEVAKGSTSVTATSTGVQLGALSSTQILVATLHVFSISGTGQWTLTIESDDNSGFGTPTTRGTFTSVDQTDDPTFEVLKISGAITDDYWRAVMTEDSGTSTLTYAVTLGIH